MEETFRRYDLLKNGSHLNSRVSVRYGGPRLKFVFDYSYRPNGVIKYLHAVGLRNDVSEASELCFVFGRLRAKEERPPELTTVVDDQFPDDTRELLESSQIGICASSRLNKLALSIRRELEI